jgi:malonate-semialdehyde dehydrogenase (acetylating)/methylmalonate-semialdehyde dehydrogenase
MQELTHYIGGQHVKGKSGRFADVMNPATGEVQAKVPLASNDEMAEAVAVAAKAQVDWARQNGSRRQG